MFRIVAVTLDIHAGRHYGAHWWPLVVKWTAMQVVPRKGYNNETCEHTHTPSLRPLGIRNGYQVDTAVSHRKRLKPDEFN